MYVDNNSAVQINSLSNKIYLLSDIVLEKKSSELLKKYIKNNIKQLKNKQYIIPGTVYHYFALSIQEIQNTSIIMIEFYRN